MVKPTPAPSVIDWSEMVSQVFRHLGIQRQTPTIKTFLGNETKHQAAYQAFAVSAVFSS